MACSCMQANQKPLLQMLNPPVQILGFEAIERICERI